MIDCTLFTDMLGKLDMYVTLFDNYSTVYSSIPLGEEVIT